MRGTLRFSIVIPTYQRRDVVLKLVRALGQQKCSDFEAIVVVDGSTDGTACALRDLRTDFRLVVVEQRRQGAALARNAGAAVADGDVLLFLDDDMEPHPAMLAEHDRSHREGADVVLGDIPLHPNSPRTPIAAATGRWAQRRRQRLSSSQEDILLPDLLTGQMSIARATFERLGAFDAAFTRGGRFGGEDLDFGYRAKVAGLRIVFNPAAISYQYYNVDAATYTRRSRDAGCAAVQLTSKYPELATELAHSRAFATRRGHFIFGTLAAAPASFSWPVRRLAIWLFSTPPERPRSNRLFFAVQTMERTRGMRQAKRALRRRLATVIAYHSVSDLREDPVLAEYGVRAGRLAAQLDALSACGFHFVDLESLLTALNGERQLAPRAILVTFDDAYVDLLEAGLPILTERGIPAVAFAVSGHVGGTNAWERRAGTLVLDLLDEAGLRSISDQGVAVGSHGMTHRPVVGLDPAELDRELQESARQLGSFRLPTPSAFSYPHGEWNREVADAVKRAGYVAAFTVDPGVIRRSTDRYALPRIEVLASDTPMMLMFKVAVAGWQERVRRRPLRAFISWRAHGES
jgi:glycosyltransferase involved in cell wall biosynthesis/peptidoglycan/xylan/chitin deacetylase (PgdA/CDA1 family)